MLDAQADALVKDANTMCRAPSATYEFAGEFCKAVVHESLALENRANILGRKPSMSGAGAPTRSGFVRGGHRKWHGTYG